MPDYRRRCVAGGTYFFTLCTYDRRPIFSDASMIEHLRGAVRSVQLEQPFELVAAVVLPDHVHWLWTMPEGDAEYSKRMGRIKALFTKMVDDAALGGAHPTATARSPSRARHREGNVWQRRFWEHAIRDQDDFNNHIHFNPVKHGLVRCPHQWNASSFSRWVAGEAYPKDWCCVCEGATAAVPYPSGFGAGE
jgi:putative transposase